MVHAMHLYDIHHEENKRCSNQDYKRTRDDIITIPPVFLPYEENSL